MLVLLRSEEKVEEVGKHDGELYCQCAPLAIPMKCWKRAEGFTEPRRRETEFVRM